MFFVLILTEYLNFEKLILDGKIKERGVLMPTTDIIIDSVLKAVNIFNFIDPFL